MQLDTFGRLVETEDDALPGFTVDYAEIEDSRVVDVSGANPSIWPEGVELVPLVDGVGWAKARNCGLRRARGNVVIVVDGSIEAAGDVLSPLARALEDPTTGIAGPFGIVTSDLRERGH